MLTISRLGYYYRLPMIRPSWLKLQSVSLMIGEAIHRPMITQNFNSDQVNVSW